MNKLADPAVEINLKRVEYVVIRWGSDVRVMPCVTHGQEWHETCRMLSGLAAIGFSITQSNNCIHASCGGATS